MNSINNSITRPKNPMLSARSQQSLILPYSWEFLASLNFDDGWRDVVYPEVQSYAQSLADVSENISLKIEETKDAVIVALQSMGNDESDIKGIYDISKKLMTDFSLSPIFQEVRYNPHNELYPLPWRVRIPDSQDKIYPRMQVQEALKNLYLIRYKLEDIDAGISYLVSQERDDLRTQQLNQLTLQRESFYNSIPRLEQEIESLMEELYIWNIQRDIWDDTQMIFSKSAIAEDIISPSTKQQENSNSDLQTQVLQEMLEFFKWQKNKKKPKNKKNKKNKKNTPKTEAVKSLRHQFTQSITPEEQELIWSIQDLLITPIETTLLEEDKKIDIEKSVDIDIRGKNYNFSASFNKKDNSLSLQIKTPLPKVILNNVYNDEWRVVTARFHEKNLIQISQNISVVNNKAVSEDIKYVSQLLFTYINSLEEHIKNYDTHNAVTLEESIKPKTPIDQLYAIAYWYLYDISHSVNKLKNGDIFSYVKEQARFFKTYNEVIYLISHMSEEDVLNFFHINSDYLLSHSRSSDFTWWSSFKAFKNIESYISLLIGFKNYKTWTVKGKEIPIKIKKNKSDIWFYKTEKASNNFWGYDWGYSHDEREIELSDISFARYQWENRHYEMRTNRALKNHEVTKTKLVYAPIIEEISKHYRVEQINSDMGMYNICPIIEWADSGEKYFLRFYGELLPVDAKCKMFQMHITPIIIPYGDLWDTYQDKVTPILQDVEYHIRNSPHSDEKLDQLTYTW